MTLLIAIEGPDKVGKETQTKMLVEHLRQLNFKVLHIECPIQDSFTHKKIYEMLGNGSAKKSPNLFQFVQFLNKYALQLKLPLLKLKYDYIVFDRWNLSAFVYGKATRVNPTFNKWMFDRLRSADATIVLTGRKHDTSRQDDDYEKDNDLQTCVRNEYSSWVQSHPLNYRMIDCKGTRIDVHNRILESLNEMGVV